VARPRRRRAPSSTIDLERAANPFLQCADVTAMIAFKQDWPAFTLRLGLKELDLRSMDDC
jgi:hypothetical protein